MNVPRPLSGRGRFDSESRLPPGSRLSCDPMSRFKHPLPDQRWPSADEAAASRLFSPLPIRGPCVAEARTWVPAMVPWRASAEGDVTDDVIEWYGRFADGRPGVLVVEATGIRDIPSGPLLRIGHDRCVPGLARLVDEVRRRSGGHTRLFIQIIDFLSIRRRPPAEKYFRRFFAITDTHREAIASRTGDDAWTTCDEDAVRDWLLAQDDDTHRAVLAEREYESLTMGARERVTDLHLPHVAELPRVLPALFADAARRAEEAGLDGVELHYAHAYTMASFLSRTNDRDDGYGGSIDGRARLPLEVFRAARDAVSDDFVVGCRFLGDEVIDGGSRIDDACEFARRFADAGMDFLSVSKGGRFEDANRPRVGEAAYPYTGKSGHECMPTVFMEDAPPFGRNVPLSAAIRRAVRKAGHTTPVVAAGGINGFDLAEGILRRDEADLVAAARQSLADPDWWEKMRRGRGAEVRRCLYTNYCEALDQRHKAVTCQLWDRLPVGEGEPAPVRTADGKRRLLPPEWVGRR